MKKIKTKNILVTVGIVILLAVIVYVRSRISPLFGNYSVEKNEKKVEAKPTMDTKSQETKKSQEKTETLSTGINSYWNMQGSGKVKFDVSAGFYDEWGDIPALKYKTKMNFIKIAKLKKGILYHLKIEQASELKIPTKRLSLGYFYVQKNRIMRIWENNDYEAQGNVWTLSKKTLNRIIKTSEIPKYSTIVWQKKTYKDTLKHDKIDWHQYLKKIQDSPKKRLRYGGYYQYPQHSGYWETFIWEEGTGLIFYQSGYRDGVECIRLKRKGVKLPSDVWYD
ncbi:hypothetical protein [Clostridium sp. AF36-4]|uniref:hypothetical protein n=1 Tax=Clostridium sp. AF36-4 TaxID=2293015 RepID=UPI000E3F193E|nr:hypothetical protein [Clostridium sp. AF36-4]RGF54078.1 hypothetical protein DW005_10520 [Clostridium sp. AF36-4]